MLRMRRDRSVANQPRPDVATGNFFLDSLSLHTRAQVLPMLAFVSLRSGQVLGEAEPSAEHVFFPVLSVITTVAEMSDGSSAAVGFTGRDGFSDLSFVFDVDTNVQMHRTIASIAGSAYSISNKLLAVQQDTDHDFRKHAAAYANYTYVAATQFAACNALHSIDQRYARWLLMAYDRVGPAEYILTQETVAQMLGVRRASVTLVAGALSKAGIISYHRGKIHVLDQEKLVEAACECYGMLASELQRLMGYFIHTT